MSVFTPGTPNQCCSMVVCLFCHDVGGAMAAGLAGEGELVGGALVEFLGSWRGGA